MNLETLKNLELSLISGYEAEKKECPTCHKKVYKKRNQMYCYHCFIGFDWDTLEVLSKQPLYIFKQEKKEFMSFYIHKSQENEFSFRIPNDYNILKRTYKNLFDLQNILMKFRINDVTYNEDVRTKFSEKKINEEEFTNELSKRLKKMNDKKEIYNILKDYLIEAFKYIFEFVDFWNNCIDKWNMSWIYSSMYKNYQKLLQKTEEKLCNYKEYKITLQND
jgi:hypothetical protein